MDTETPDNTEHLPGQLSAAAVKTRRSGKLLIAESAVELDGNRYPIGDLPSNSLVWCGLNGIRRHLLSAKSPADAWAALVKGDLPSDGAGKIKELENRRLACAMAQADVRRRAENVKAGTPAAATILDECKEAARLADKTKIAEMLRFNGSAASHLAKLEGKDTPMLAAIAERSAAA